MTFVEQRQLAGICLFSVSMNHAISRSSIICIHDFGFRSPKTVVFVVAVDVHGRIRSLDGSAAPSERAFWQAKFHAMVALAFESGDEAMQERMRQSLENPRDPVDFDILPAD